MRPLIEALKVRGSQGQQFVPDVRRANPVGFRGLPVIDAAPCAEGCSECVDACPTSAIQLQPFTLDLGRCVFCDECARVCPQNKVKFTAGYRMASRTRAGLIMREGSADLGPMEASDAIRKMFGRSLKLRSVSAGGCNGCELEINAISNVNFDASRYGIDIVASPRHADGLILSGPITANMAEALELCYQGMPDPKFVIAVGACTISGGVFEPSPVLDRSFLGRFAPELYIAGCPPHPLAIVNGILDLLGHADGRW
jgi:Ni,Fe-hydrogenase III small subunit/Pyruvate/2-oxoacid:ferredoxin oxidoreductase delta subunit